MNRTVVPLLPAAVSLLAASNVFAAFNANGVDIFSGTTQDLGTWQELIQSPTGVPVTVTQNNGLTVIADGANIGNFDYIAHNNPILVGGFAQVDVTVHSHVAFSDVGQYAGLILTTNTTNGSQPFNSDSEYFDIPESFNPTTSFQAEKATPAGGLGNPIGPLVPLIDTTYTLRIDRLTTRDFTFTVKDTGGNTLESLTEDLGSVTTLYPGLFDIATTATFNNFTIGNAPEPASLTLLLAAPLLLTRRRKHID